VCDWRWQRSTSTTFCAAMRDRVLRTPPDGGERSSSNSRKRISLPVKINHLLDKATEADHMLKGPCLRQAERAPGEKPRPPDPRP
jgi:hypothetical protein